MIAISGCGSGGPAADLVLYGGQVLTINETIPMAEAVAVIGDRIAWMGSSGEAKGWIGEDTRVIDLDGRLVIPGIIDAHVHFLSGGLRLMQLDCREARSSEELVGLVKNKAARLSKGEWITGGGWDESLWDSPKLPDRHLLDRAAPNNPVKLSRVDGHSCVVNSLALKLSRIDRNTPDPGTGKIDRESSTGEPTGVLREAAQGLIRGIPDPGPEQKEKAMELALAEARRLGVTGVHAIGGPGELKLFQKFLDRDKLTLRAYFITSFSDAYDYLNPARDLGITRGFGGDFIRVGCFKDFIDGSMGSRTAFLFESFSDEPGNVGIPEMTQRRLNNICRRAAETNSQPAVHAIGDRGVNMVATAYQKAGLTKADRPRIEHTQIVRLEDMTLLAESGAVASMQPTHATSDMRWAETRLGPERVKGAYAWKSILDAGVPVAFGTDWPVEPLNPMLGLYAAVTRQDADGNPAGGWYPEQCLTLREAIRLYTAGAAYAAFWETDTGSITPGKLADMVVLSQNILELPPSEILKTQADFTILGGRIVHEAD
ncbi:amidohydrolase [candidate division KSB1 bacterium]